MTSNAAAELESRDEDFLEEDVCGVATTANDRYNAQEMVKRSVAARRVFMHEIRK